MIFIDIKIVFVVYYRSIVLLCEIRVLLCIIRCVRVKKKTLRLHFFEGCTYSTYYIIGLIFKSLKLVIKIGVRRKRNSNSRFIGCQEKIIFESVYGTPDYKVFHFDEFLNHPLENRSDLKKMCASTPKIGSTMAHKLRASFRGGYEFVMRGGYEFLKLKVIDYKNLRRDINRVIVEFTIQSTQFNCQDDVWILCFGLMKLRRHIMLNLVMLSRIEWFLFHLLLLTIIKNQILLERAFLKTHGKEPTLVLTDEDAAIKQAIENVFPNSNHRLCMWHIMKKLKNKALF
uniref:Protein FAR1-RELATED SEQUENCE n=1 Tax=Lactuca sativa TaxID=4236 RepID=A0A9R1VMF6_LACSA|nr:hypothetical protein LSAT_V11C400226200 [Lactuca sativa]